MSSRYRARPVTLSTPSRRGGERPTTPTDSSPPSAIPRNYDAPAAPSKPTSNREAGHCCLVEGDAGTHHTLDVGHPLLDAQRLGQDRIPPVGVLEVVAGRRRAEQLRAQLRPEVTGDGD